MTFSARPETYMEYGRTTQQKVLGGKKRMAAVSFCGYSLFCFSSLDPSLRIMQRYILQHNLFLALWIHDRLFCYLFDIAI